jgi:hypothetical protein
MVGGIMRLARLLTFGSLVAASAQAMPLGLVGEQLPPVATPIHGCHDNYEKDMRGWHRHARHCQPQRGLTRAKRDKKPAT